MEEADIYSQFDKFQIDGVVLRNNMSPSRLTTMGTGGEVQYVFDVSDINALSNLTTLLNNNKKDFRVIGNGSNVILPDKPLSQPLIRLDRGFRTVTLVDEGNGIFLLGAGVSVIGISRDLCMQGYSGLEFSSGIPASVGGAAYMNAGAHGGEWGDIIQSVTILTQEGAIKKISIPELKFSYRKSYLPPRSIILFVEIQLKKDDKDRIMKKRKDCLDYRKSTQPLTYPSSGSVFRNPINGSAGKIIEDAGLKGVWYGGVQVSELHGNWIINPDRQGSSDDVKGLVIKIQETVLAKFGILLEPEIYYL